MRPMSHASRTLLALTLAAAFGGFAATALRDGLDRPAHAEPAMPVAVPAVTALPTAVAGQPLPSLAPMLERVTPAVVSVRTRQVVRVSPFGDDPFFRRMFPELSQQQLNQSLGSGVIIDAKNGYVLTNHHVIEGADDVTVTLADGRTVKAEFVGSDPDTDVAVMRIQADNLTAIPLADSDRLRVGDFVVENVMQQLLAGGVVRRGTLGIETQDVDERIASSLGLDVARGAAVTRVYAGSAGEKAGLEPGDVIVAANGQRIDDSETLRNFQGLQAPDAKVALDVRRAGKPLQLSATLREQPRALDGNALDPRLSGARFAELPETARRGGISGVLVAEVARGSRAASNGLRAGDVVLAASSGGFSDLPGFRASVGKQPAQLVLRILRGGRQGTLPMQ